MSAIGRQRIVTIKSIIKQWKEKALSLPKEKRQEFMDYIFEGLTIGQAQEKANVTFEQAMGILDLNIPIFIS